MRARVFVGDVQGCADEMEDLLAAIDYDPALIDLWFVGDLVNRGPASARALRRVMALGAGSVLGNHDLHLLGVAAGERPTRKDDTISDILEAKDREELLAWLRARPLVRVWDDLILVHAGLHPRWRDPRAIAAPLEEAVSRGEIPWDDENLRFMTGVRHCDSAGRRPTDDRTPSPGFAPWDAHYRGKRKVVCGHWASRGFLRTERVRGLDSGCVWGRRLTAWNAVTDAIISVPARATYRQVR
ncbi:MAG: metallophosphoesterase [Deltaproteobacteria bacterium]|nr:metallophosphoesterase [Deltaproteobacteria bacterium]